MSYFIHLVYDFLVVIHMAKGVGEALPNFLKKYYNASLVLSFLFNFFCDQISVLSEKKYIPVEMSL